jgi:hypothetical protein
MSFKRKKSVQRVVQDVLYDDPDIREFDAILIQEPHYLQNRRNPYITGVGHDFEPVESRCEGDAGKRIQSCIWVNKKDDFLQIHTGNPDIPVIRMTFRDRCILMASAYVSCRGTQVEGDGRGQVVVGRRLKI